MYIIKVECKNCKSESLIKEEVLGVSGEQKMEEAYCLNCQEKIYDGQTDGWFSVKKVNIKSKENKECTYPMA